MEKDKKLIMVTGANKGIGLEIIKTLLKTHPEYKFFMCVRSMERGKAALEELKKLYPDAESKVTVHDLDITNSKSIDKFVDWIKTSKTKIDCLVNNAGVLIRTTDVTEEVINQIFPTNYYGTIELTEKLVPLLPDGAKVVLIGGAMGTYMNLKNFPLKEKLEDPKLTLEGLAKIVHEFCNDAKAKKLPPITGMIPAYSASKLFLNYYTKVYANEKTIRDRGIQVYACHPGWVQTELGGPGAKLTLEQGAVCPCFVINLPWKIDENYQGKFISDCKVTPI